MQLTLKEDPEGMRVPSSLSTCYVVGGRFLLHRVLWQAKESFSFTLKKYVDYTKKHFNEGATIDFDGYPKDAARSTKSVESIRRTKKYIVGYVMFDKSISATTSQEKFFSNDKNKQRLMNMLCFKFQEEGFVVKQAEEDVGYLIIKCFGNRKMVAMCCGCW
ncbi:hypothetical protein AVEN_55478-1 [Araneus ventricosus]|uniref:Uncharacterized protein n=1 Tax=Araneus ventricosus TaxID=182803 RepID=A0A4Y2X7V2_ARAVE|nr:hypothetical protein AVEN_55478-1 [Araneus ventricosus]